MPNKAGKIVGTHRKLGEARFFLEHLRKVDERTLSRNPIVFWYYLSAFLAAAKSVVDVLIYESQSSDCFQKWRSQLPDQDQNLFEFTVNQRRSELHHRGASYLTEDEPASTYFYPSVQPLPLSVLFSEMEIGPSGWVRIVTHVPEKYFQIKGKRIKVIEAARRYVELLEDLVTFCGNQSG